MPHSDIQSIGVHHELTGRVRMNPYGSCGEALLEVPERPVRSWGSREQNLGRGECRQGRSQGAVALDKVVIKVGESQERLHLYTGRRPWEIHHHHHLPGIHLYPPCSDDVTQKRDAGAMEFALLLLL